MASLVLMVLCMAMQGVLSTEELTMYSSGTSAVTGDNVWFMCMLPLTSSTHNRSISINREVIDGQNTCSTCISTNGKLRKKYSNLTRFRAQRINNKDETLFVLHIFNVKYEDTGKYVCHDEQTKNSHSIQFEVYKPPIFFGHGKTASYVFEEGEAQTVQCNIHGVFPSPKVNIFIGGEDITHAFQVQEWTVLNCNTSETSGLCPFCETYNVSLTNDALLPDYSVHGMELLCKYEIKSNASERSKSANTSVPVIYKYSPKTSCAQDKHALNRSHIIACNISSYPPPNRHVWHVWSDEKKTEVFPGTSSSGFEAAEMHFSETLRSYTLHMLDYQSTHNTEVLLKIEQEVGNKDLNFTISTPSAEPTEPHGRIAFKWVLFAVTVVVLYVLGILSGCCCLRLWRRQNTNDRESAGVYEMVQQRARD